MRSKRKHVEDEKRPAMFYGRCAAFRAALRFYIPRARKHARFRGRNIKIQNAFTAALWPRYNGSNFTISLLSELLELAQHRPVPRGATVTARKHQKRKTPDRRYNSGGTLPVDKRTRFVKSGLKQASLHAYSIARN